MKFGAFTLIALVFAIPSFSVAGVRCDGAPAGAPLNKSGTVFIEISSPECEKDLTSKNCVTYIERSSDICIDDHKVMKVWCESGYPASKEYPCPANTRCQDGACK